MKDILISPDLKKTSAKVLLCERIEGNISFGENVNMLVSF